MEKLIIPRKEPGKIEKYYDEITDAYKDAFSGPPWFEKTKCVDPGRRCKGGFSALTIGEQCAICELRTSEPAYNDAELIARFKELTDTRPVAWWLEFSDKRLAMAALAWVATPQQISFEKYADVSAMDIWLAAQFGRGKQIIWLDEVFANKKVRSNQNLRNFCQMNRRFSETFRLNTTAYRTITPQMVVAARKLGKRASILSAKNQVPDRRDFVVIKNKEND